MERAWVLVSAASDAAEDLADHISAIKGVRLIDRVRGQFALVAAIRLPDRESLTRVVDDIRQLEGVKQVSVCEVIASQRIATRGADPGWP